MRVRGSSAHCRFSLSQNWSFASAPPGSISSPGDDLDALGFEPAQVPGTVAKALGDLQRLDWSHPPDLDGSDHWYRCRLPEPTRAGRNVLVFDGLATLADVWVGKRHVLSTENMFRRYEVDVTGALEEEERTLTIRFRSLTAALRTRRPRPRYRTRLVDDQQLRWFRTTLIGRTPGFCPRLPPIGPYRSVWLETRTRWARLDVRWSSRVHYCGGARQRESAADIDVTVQLEGSRGLETAELRLEGAAVNTSVPLSCRSTGSDRSSASGSAHLPRVALWWPHTHGGQPLSRVTLRLRFRDEEETVDLGKIGFRHIERSADEKRFGLSINGIPIFCRGACWSTDDVLALGGALEPRRTLDLVRRAGMNMLRIGGTMAYENDAFYDLCDELGVMVFQDFMFANMDYPGADPDFRDSVRAEAEGILSDLASRPSLAVLCGGSEVEQQASMLGLPRDQWTDSLFTELLPSLARQWVPEVPYVASTPSGGALPFHTNEGICHYYGVGAYRRPMSDVRASSVAFASECLAFANVPEEATLTGFLPDLATAPHHPRWKERVPRDRGVGWDFDDVRDHYVRTLFDVDPVDVRYSDVNRYLALGRVATGEVMERVIAEWRRPGSGSSGALVWLLKDFWPGAGWGVIDATGTPKSSYHALARGFAPVTVLLTDEGLNGYALHAVNDTADAIDARVRVAAFRDGSVRIAGAECAVTLPARGGTTLSVDGILGRFYDLSHAYRFGPPSCDVVVAWLDRESDGSPLGRTFAFPAGLPSRARDDIGLSAHFDKRTESVCMSSRRLALAVHLDVPGCEPEDQYFHLAPGERRAIALRGSPRAGGWVTALNASTAARIAKTAPELDAGGDETHG